MVEDESFNEFYAKLKNIMNLAINLGETILEPKMKNANAKGFDKDWKQSSSS